MIQALAVLEELSRVALVRPDFDKGKVKIKPLKPDYQPKVIELAEKLRPHKQEVLEYLRQVVPVRILKAFTWSKKKPLLWSSEECQRLEQVMLSRGGLLGIWDVMLQLGSTALLIEHQTLGRCWLLHGVKPFDLLKAHQEAKANPIYLVTKEALVLIYTPKP